MKFNRVCILALLALILPFANHSLVAQSGGFGASVELNDGSLVDAEIRSINGEHAVVVVDGQENSLPLDTVAKIRFSDHNNEPAPLVHTIAMIDGSTILSEAFSISDRELLTQTNSGVEVQISTRLIDYVKFPAGDAAVDSNWQDTVAQERESDALVVSRDQKLQMIDGVIGNVSAESVSFTVGERTADVKRNRLAGMLFYRRVIDDFPPPTCLLDLADGSKLMVRSVETDENSFLINTVAGAKFSINPDALVSIDFSANRSVWLADLDPATNDWEPLLTSASVLDRLKKFSLARIDESFAGKPLAILFQGEDESWQRQQFAKGFAIKGGGKISFLLSGQYQRLSGLVAFDPDANAAGIVKLVVQVDGLNRVEEVLDAAEMKRPFSMDVDLTDAKRIVFQVQYHDRRSVGDILHAVDMKLHR
ncbi:NPCBM/NEW2 domain-containing protein [Mariniblastus fucicola]|uniref:NPCBM/NEW2 domain protein n=1 Tax=Mariniblastus fucicola TaxID=980251 RepID=A0A5B9PAP8_9BACT|nr:NPCBM/NEW2 domain-containing protein [Mariniblastus fucicola]QEG22559.1 NPCBM/NEW2 domain protein [Mariniblastus fucicola]